MQSLPSQVKVGPLIYVVREEPRLASMGLYGQLVRPELAIELLPGMSLHMQEVTLWHEVVHEILEQVGVKGEETVINRLAYGIVGTLQDNPKLTK